MLPQSLGAFIPSLLFVVFIFGFFPRASPGTYLAAGVTGWQAKAEGSAIKSRGTTREASTRRASATCSLAARYSAAHTIHLDESSCGQGLRFLTLRSLTVVFVSRYEARDRNWQGAGEEDSLVCACTRIGSLENLALGMRSVDVIQIHPLSQEVYRSRVSTHCRVRGYGGHIARQEQDDRRGAHHVSQPLLGMCFGGLIGRVER